MVLCNSGEGSGTVEETAVTTIPDQSVVYLNQNFTTGKAGYTGIVRDRQRKQKFRKPAERMPNRDVPVLVFTV